MNREYEIIWPSRDLKIDFLKLGNQSIYIAAICGYFSLKRLLQISSSRPVGQILYRDENKKTILSPTQELGPRLNLSRPSCSFCMKSKILLAYSSPFLAQNKEYNATKEECWKYNIYFRGHISFLTFSGMRYMKTPFFSIYKVKKTRLLRKIKLFFFFFFLRMWG